MNNDETTRDALIEAGRTLFAQHGYAGASVRAITAAAGANLGAITYHFGSKEALYFEVVDRTIAPFGDRVVAAARGEGSALDRAAAVVEVYVEHLAEHPEIPRLLILGLLRDGAPPAGALSHMMRIKSALTELILEGQREGTIRAGNPLVHVLGILAQPIYLQIVRSGLRALLPIDIDAPQHRREILEGVQAFVRAGLEARQEGEEP